MCDDHPERPAATPGLDASSAGSAGATERGEVRKGGGAPLRGRFYLPRAAIESGRVSFDAEEARHIARTLRLRPGDLVAAVDGDGTHFTVRLERVTPRAVEGAITAVEPKRAESPLAITLAQGIPKGDKLEAIIRACVELGVVRIVPVVTERTIVRLDPARGRDRLRRWQRVAKEAAKQCGRAVIPPVEAPRTLAGLLAAEEPDGLRLCLWEEEARPLDAVLAAVEAPPRPVTVLVGPEGGLSAAEVEAARSRGFVVAGLGPSILRTETAGPAVVAILQSRFGDLGR
ncbi:MAG: 16S rRNA (uracil(1498)-N(3))-methyltransferase [Candidatus Rokubacteria bacterium]|nr:16S rRNA (uracil(1498)-N(3))-methyltransferase [Candidatus Rokubacteria bacterium]